MRSYLLLIAALSTVANCEQTLRADDKDSAAAATVCGIYVATNSGSDTAGCGLSPANPCASINFGISRAVAQSVSCVFVQAGVYDEVITLTSGVHIEGGFDQNWNAASYSFPSHQVRIRGGLYAPSSQYMTVRAVSLVTPTRLSNLIIQGPNVPATGALGKSSYAVYASASNRLVLENVQIESGNGAPGAPGSSGNDAPPPTSAMNGQQGQHGQLSLVCNSSTRGAGGGAGTNLSCGGAATTGGAGGQGGTADTSCPTFTSPTAGLLGGDGAQATAGFGTGGAGGPACGSGVNGLSGRVTNGAAGNGAIGGNGSVVGGFWIGNSGGSGGLGANGGGGGGGGGAGGCDANGNYYGAGGGGGGAGGCAATSGGGGSAGGGSFGVFAVNSTVQLTNVFIQRGQGGNGGAGGIGGRGQDGGIGAPGAIVPGGGVAGSGGNGGHGGHGGGGGGGAGGISAGVFCSSSMIAQNGVIVTGGAGGTGGIGGASAPGGQIPAGNAGLNGSDGSVLSILSCSSTTPVAVAACDNAPCTPQPCAADIAPAGGDGQVNVSDLLAVINGWGICP